MRRDSQAGLGKQGLDTDIPDDLAMSSHDPMMHDASSPDKRLLHQQTGYALCMTTAAERLKEAREKAGYSSASAAAEAMGITISTYVQHENGARNYPSHRAVRYAKFFRVAPEWLLYGRGNGEPIMVEPELTRLPLIGAIQAGSWMALDDTDQQEPEMVAHARDAAYSHARQWLRVVRGDSMNAVGIEPGDLAHLAEFFGSSVENGMIVEVTRSRDGGLLKEITLKEVEITSRGILLWPRSRNPRWKDPVSLTEGAAGDITVEITGILVATTRRFRRAS